MLLQGKLPGQRPVIRLVQRQDIANHRAGRLQVELRVSRHQPVAPDAPAALLDLDGQSFDGLCVVVVFFGHIDISRSDILLFQVVTGVAIAVLNQPGAFDIPERAVRQFSFPADEALQVIRVGYVGKMDKSALRRNAAGEFVLGLGNLDLLGPDVGLFEIEGLV